MIEFKKKIAEAIAKVINKKEEKVSKKQFLSQVSNILKKDIINLGNIYVSEGEKRGNLIRFYNKNCQRD